MYAMIVNKDATFAPCGRLVNYKKLMSLREADLLRDVSVGRGGGDPYVDCQFNKWQCGICKNLLFLC